MSQIADYIKDAEIGDTVWLYDLNANNYNEDRKYVGRGKWYLVKVDGKTRQSLICHNDKFDIATGHARGRSGFTPTMTLYGQKEYEKRAWLQKNETDVKRAVERCNDVEVLKRIAELVGYEEKP